MSQLNTDTEPLYHILDGTITSTQLNSSNSTALITVQQSPFNTTTAFTNSTIPFNNNFDILSTVGVYNTNNITCYVPTCPAVPELKEEDCTDIKVLLKHYNILRESHNLLYNLVLGDRKINVI